VTEVIFATDSRLRSINGFERCTSLSRLEIPACVEEIHAWAFCECSGLTEVIFATDSRLRTLAGFERCTSLSQLAIPASVEEIHFWAFCECSGLKEVIFATDSRLKEINGFRGCRSLNRMEIPASVESIGSSATGYSCGWGFLGDVARRELIFESGTRLRPNAKGGCFQVFVIFKDENDLKRRRRQVHMRTWAF
jgi:hypothetical protein